MHASVSSNVPAFLSKLWSMVNEEGTDPVIGWTEDGTSFYLRNQATFSMELLPIFYKHNNLASFVRQLNMYGFRKVLMPLSGSLRNESDEMVFAHPDFIKDHPEQLDNIKRKEKQKVANSGNQELVARMYGDVKNMKNKQDTLDLHLDKMKRENEALWREVLLLRQKHSKQQQIVNKLIQFLISIVQPSRGNTSLGLKRKHQLPMLEDSLGEVSAKQPRLNRTFSLDDAAAALDSSLAASCSPGGPVIHELTDQSPAPSSEQIPPSDTGSPAPANFSAASPSASSTADYASLPEQLVTSPPPSSSAVSTVNNDDQYILPHSPPQVHVQIHPERPEIEENGGQQAKNDGQPPNSDTTVALQNNEVEVTPVLCDSLLESIQADLDGLRGLIGSPNWRLDSVQNILSDPDSVLAGGGASGGDVPADQQQMITYNPSLLDLFNSDVDDQLFPDLDGLTEDDEEVAASLPAVEAPPAKSETKALDAPSGSGLNTPVIEFRSSPKFPAPVMFSRLPASSTTVKKVPAPPVTPQKLPDPSSTVQKLSAPPVTPQKLSGPSTTVQKMAAPVTAAKFAAPATAAQFAAPATAAQFAAPATAAQFAAPTFAAPKYSVPLTIAPSKLKSKRQK